LCRIFFLFISFIGTQYYTEAAKMFIDFSA